MACFRVILILLCFHGWLISAVEYKMDGVAYVTYALPPLKRSTSRTPHTIHMLFRTAQPSGLLMHGRGTGGDFVTVEIVRGKLRYASVFDRENLKPGYQDVVVGDDLGDDQWHQIDIERHGNHVIIKLDITKKYITPTVTQEPLNIDKDLSIARLPPHSWNVTNDPLLPLMSLTNQSFQGCMEDVSYNEVNIFQEVQQRSKFVYVTGKLQAKCAEDKEYLPAVTLRNPISFIQLNQTKEKNFALQFKFRTFDQSGVLVHQSFGKPSNGNLFIEMVLGKLWFNYNSDIWNTEVNLYPKIPSLANGFWHSIQLNLSDNAIVVQLNNDTIQRISYISQRPFYQNSVLGLGSKIFGKSSIIGCMKEIYLDQVNVMVDLTMARDVDIAKCYLVDRCYTNPCLHRGRCLQQNNTLRCDCSYTGYYGRRCENIEKVPVSATSNYQTTTARITTTTSKPTQSLESSKYKSRKVIVKSTKLPTAASKITPSILTSSKLSVLPTTKSPSKIVPSVITTAKLPPIAVMTTTKLSFTMSEILPSSIASTMSPSTALNVLLSRHLTYYPKELSSKSTLSIKQQSPLFTTQSEMPSSAPSQNFMHSTKIARVSRINNSQSPSATKVHFVSSVRAMNPTGTPTTRKNDQRIIIIEKQNELPAVGLSKDQILVYFFLAIVFILFIGLVVIISVKMTQMKLCACLGQCALTARHSSPHVSLELRHHGNEGNAGKRTRNRPPSLNDSGIDPSDSGATSNRNSSQLNIVEEHDRVQVDYVAPPTSSENSQNGNENSQNLNGNSQGTFLVLQDEPCVYTQQSFGWTGDGAGPSHSRTLTNTFVENEQDHTSISSSFEDLSSSENLTHDNEHSSEKWAEKTHNLTTYRQLQEEDNSSSSSFDDVYIDIKS